MKRLATKMMVSPALLAILVAAETAYARTPYGRESPEVYRDGAPATANDSWESGVAGKRVRVQPNDAIEDGRVVGEDPDPNIRSQLQRNTTRVATATDATTPRSIRIRVPDPS